MIKVSWPSSTNRAWKYSPCSYAFVAQKGWYNFSQSHLNGTGEKAFDILVGERSAPLLLEWAISREGACASAHSHRVSVRDGHEYRCNCSQGYMGNPYD
ncbi:hypothetical protein PR202_ga22763 [Eleusine coracana subsp. coracana]|uniref:Uncharacterized protein n=1 Tax=Eleusine coracana subsp. coracana TaxID=191504 RepID=A0AAV5D504_ELECO|nr:hypothetical protein PR202_ga22763 [Eleusine coracana subsp. coracana]